MVVVVVVVIFCRCRCRQEVVIVVVVRESWKGTRCCSDYCEDEVGGCLREKDSKLGLDSLLHLLKSLLAGAVGMEMETANSCRWGLVWVRIFNGDKVGGKGCAEKYVRALQDHSWRLKQSQWDQGRLCIHTAWHRADILRKHARWHVHTLELEI